MFNLDEINELKECLPGNGKALISNRTGLTFTTVNKFFSGRKVREENSEIIWTTGWAIIKEHKERVQALKEMAHQVKKIK